MLIDSCGVIECCTTSSSHRNKTKGHRSVERGLKSAPHPEEDVGKEVRPSTPFFCSLQTLPPFLISLPSFAPSPLHRLPGSTKAAAQPPLLGRRHTEAARGRRLLPRGGKGNGLRRPQDPLGVSVARAPPRPPPPTAAPPPRGPSSPPPLGRRPPPREGRTRALRDPRRRQAGTPVCEREQQSSSSGGEEGRRSESSCVSISSGALSAVLANTLVEVGAAVLPAGAASDISGSSSSLPLSLLRIVGVEPEGKGAFRVVRSTRIQLLRPGF